MASVNSASTKPGTQAPPEDQSSSPVPESGVEAKSAPLAMTVEAGARAGVPALDKSGKAMMESSAAHLAGLAAQDVQSIDRKFQILLDTVHANRPADDLEIIRKAWAFCLQQHEGQKRASGEPYVIHPLEVGQVLAELKMDSTAIAAGLLHDAVEDTD